MNRKFNFIVFCLVLLFSTGVQAQLTEGFESATLTGWSLYADSTDDPGFVQTTSRVQSGSSSFFHDDANISGVSNSWMVSPAYVCGANDELRFWYNHNFTPTYYNYSGVWISTTSSDPIANPAAFTELLELNSSAPGGFSEDTWTEAILNLAAYSGQTIYIAFRFTGDFDHELYIDNFSLDAVPSCLAPSALVTNNVMATSVDLGWTENGTATSWEIEYGSAGFVQGTGTSVVVAGNPHTLTGLNSSTSYDFYVRAICGPGDTSVWSLSQNFTTACATFTAPFAERFTTNSLPNCWTEAGDNTWEYGSNSTVPTGFADYGADLVPDHSPGGGGTFIGMDGSDNGNGEVSELYSPFVDISSLTIPQLSYWVFSNNVDDAAQNKLIVEFYDGAAWTVVDSIQQNLGANWVQFTTDLTTFTVTGPVQLRFTVTGDNSAGGSTYYNDILIDDVELRETPSCPDPSALTANNITATSADLGWTENGTATNWEIEYGPAGFTQGSGTSIFVSSNPFSLTGLSGSTNYEFYVRAICGAGDTSNWIGGTAFTTLATCPAPSALTASNIASTTVDLDWAENGTATNWEIEYGPAGFAQGAGTSVITATKPYNLTGLNSASDYDFYVRAICGAGDTSMWSGSFSFTTACSVYTPTYTEDFTSYIPNCWEEAQGQLGTATVLTGTTSNWTSDGFANAGSTGSAKINLYSTGRDEWLISPSIDLGTGATNYQLEFDIALTDFASTAASTLGSDDTIAVVISTDNGATWDVTNALQLWLPGTEPSNTGDRIVINLTGYTGTVKFGFYAASTVSNADNDIFIDNFVVQAIPSCPAPSALTISNITSATADIDWTENGSATNWEIQYGPAGFAAGTGSSIFTATKPYNLTGLNPATDYDIYVRAICGPGDTSTWSSSSSFTTNCPTSFTPVYTQDFSSYLPSCWEEAQGQLGTATVLTGTTSNWTSDGFANVGSTGSAKINLYSTGRDEWLISPSIDLGTGATNYQLEFDIALTDFASTAAGILGTDDTIAVVISTDNGATWDVTNALQLWLPGTEPGNTGDHITINLSGYTGTVKFGFYAASTLSNEDNDIFIDNFVVQAAPPAAPNVVITEIMYNPPEANTDSLEFIELYNNGSTAVDLQGATFIEGISHTFTNSFVIPAGGYAVLAVDSIAFASVYGIQPDAEWNSGALSNTAEDIILVTATGDTIDVVDYDDGWEPTTDAGGYSLILCDVNSDNNVASNWNAATTATGSTINSIAIFASPKAANTCINPEDVSTAISGLNMVNCGVSSISGDLLVINEGLDTSYNVPYTVTVDGNPVAAGSVDTLAPGDTAYITVGPLPVSTGSGNVLAYTSLATDIDLNNDTSAMTVFVSNIDASASITNTILCNGGTDGEATAAATNGYGTYTFQWDAAAGSQTTAIATGLAAGTYVVTAMDSIGCMDTASVTFADPAAIAVVVDSTMNVDCNGNSTGALYISVSNGTAPYSFIWSNGATTEDLMNLPAGSYTGTITDDNGCSVVGGPITISEPAILNLDSVNTMNVACFGDSSGMIDLFVSGGTTPYSFSWSNGATTEDLMNLPAGTYTVTITDANGCSIVGGPVTINQPATAFTLSLVSTTDLTCNGSNDGQAVVSPTGGSGPIYYVWSNGANDTLPNNGQAGTIQLPGGIAGVTATDVTTGCTTSLSFTINEPAPLVATATNNGNGTATASATGGTAPYSFSWSTSDTSATITGAGLVTVTITDANGCTDTASVDIVVGVELNNSAALNFNVYPNPTQANTFVDFSLPANMDVQLQIVDVAGRVVLSQNINNVQEEVIELQTNQLPEGLYMVRLMGDSIQQTKKLVITK